MRYRDWICVYADDDRLEKCLLEAHSIRVDAVHHSLLPWRRPDGTLEFVQVRSRQPLLASCTFKTPFQCFSHAIHSRYYQDLSTLPTYEKGEPVERPNAAYYTDEASGHVLIVYSPTLASPGTLDGKIEFASFVCTPLK